MHTESKERIEEKRGELEVWKVWTKMGWMISGQCPCFELRW